MRTWFRRSLLVLTPVLLGACGDSGTGLTSGLSGNVGAIRFQYSGSISGSMDATGALEVDPATNEPKRQNFSAGFNLAEIAGTPGYLGIGIQLDGQTGGRSFGFGVLGTEAASYDLGEACLVSGTRCAMAVLTIDPDLGSSTGEKEFELVSGAVKLAGAKNGRIKGTFSGTAKQVDPATGEYVAGTEIQVTNGTFDVPIRKVQDLGGMAAPAQLSRIIPLELFR